MTSTHENHDNSKSTTLSFILLFFLSMIGHELALESLSTSYNSFPHLATTITIFQFGFCVLLPLLVSRVCTGGDAIKSFPKSFQELWIYVKLSAIVYGATACATMSLTYEGVTYVTKVVFKSAKLIPTMIVGVVMDARAERSGVMIKKRNYGALEYVSAFLLCLGAAGFCMSPKDFEGGEDDETKEESIKGQVNMDGHWIGISLLAISVFCDALVPNLQQQLMQGIGCATSSPRKSSEDEEMEMKSLVDEEAGSETRSKHQQVASIGLSPQALMVNTNSIGFTLLLSSTIFRRSFLPIISFAVNNPHFLVMNLIVGVGLGTAVLAYTELIRRSGPAVAVAVATLRKVVTVVLSYIIFPKPMTGVHVVSAVLVMGGIILGSSGPGKK
jgi:adenosine 3'-phospho 5'-phosphosulfate transporter B3